MKKKAKKKAAVVVAQDEDGLRMLQRNARIAKAVVALVAALDKTDPTWRKYTLDAGDGGDEVNDAWDVLVAEMERKP